MSAHKFVAEHGIDEAKAVLVECESFECVEKPTHFDIDLDIFIHEKDFGELDESDVDLSELKHVVESVELVETLGGLDKCKGYVQVCIFKNRDHYAKRIEKAITNYQLVESFKSEVINETH